MPCQLGILPEDVNCTVTEGMNHLLEFKWDVKVSFLTREFRVQRKFSNVFHTNFICLNIY